MKKNWKRITAILIIMLMILLISGSILHNYAATTTASIGTNVQATFNSDTGAVTITSTSGTGTIDPTMWVSFKDSVADGPKTYKWRIKSINITNKVYAPVNSSGLFSELGANGIEFINFTNLDTSNVTNMSKMFYNTVNVKEVMDFSHFNTTNVTSMSQMFSSFSVNGKNRQIDLTSFNTSNVTSMYRMFWGADLITLNLSSFNMSNVTSYDEMLTNLPANDNIDIFTPYPSKELPFAYKVCYNESDLTDNTEYSAVPATLTKSIHLVERTSIYYNPNGGTITDDDAVFQNKRPSATATIRQNTYIPPEGKKFAGWQAYIDGKETIFQPGSTYSGSKDIQLRAMWENDKYTVTFKDGDTVIKTEEVEYGSGATAPTDLFKKGYTLSWDKEFNNITANLTVNAVWTKRDWEEDTKFDKIAAGDTHSMGIDVKGNLWIWGDNSEGQLGNGTTVSELEPILVMKGTKFKEIAAGHNFSLAIDEEGHLWAWGNNQYGQLGNGTTTSSLVPIKIKGDTTFSKISAGYGHSMAIDSSKVVYSCGKNEKGQLGNQTTTQNTTLTALPDIYPFWDYKAAFDISAGYNHSLSSMKGGSWGNGATFCCGSTEYGKASGTENGKWEIIYTGGLYVSAGFNHSLYIGSNKQLYTMGDNTYGQIGNGTTTNTTTYIKIMEGTKFDKISTKYNHNMAIDESGKMWLWGSNIDGQIGDGTNDKAITPKKIMEGKTFKEISAGKSHSMAIDINGNLYTWGSNEYGQLGNGTTENSSVPISITKKIYIVTFKNGEETVKVQQVEEGDAATAPELTKEGFALSWDKDFSNITENITVNAVWTKTHSTVTFKNGDEIVKTELVKHGESATAPELTKTGHTLSWDKDFSNISGDITVNAVWTPSTYNVTLHTDGGTVQGEGLTSYTYGTETQLPTDVKKSGKIFDGWYDNQELSGEKVTSISNTETGDKEFYAKWEQGEFTVTFKDGDAVLKTETVEIDSDATAPTPTKVGYTLSWDKEFTNVKEDLEVNAVWTANTDTPYKIEYYLRNKDEEVEGYDLDNSLTVNKTGTTDTNIEITSSDIKEITGYTYNADNSNNVLSGNINGDGSSVLKLYYTRNYYAITYELNGGTGENLSNSYIFGKEFVLSRAINKDGFTFEGWYDNPNFTGEEVKKIAEGETGEKTFYAKWTTEEQIKLGDINGDGNVTLIDLSLINQAIVGKITLNNVQKKAADINKDGKVTLIDLSLINQVIVGKISL